MRRRSLGLLLLLGVVLAGAAPETSGAAGDAWTVVAVIDSGFSPYHYDFLGHQHPRNLDGSPSNDFDFTTDPATYIDGYPGALAINLTIPTAPDENVSELRQGADAAAWSDFKTSTSFDINMHWFPGTKVVGALSFDGEFYDTNDAHGTRSAAVSAGNIHGTCPECLFVLIKGSTYAALEWAAAQPWIDVVTNSYGKSIVGGPVRDNVYFGAPLAETKDASEAGQTIVFSSGNGLLNAFDVPMFTYWSSEKGPDWMVTVGAVDTSANQQFSGAGKPVDISSIGESYPASGGPEANGFGQHSGTSNAAPVTAGTFAKVIQRARTLLGDGSETHVGGIVASGTPVACGAADPGCPLSDGVFTRAELQDVVFQNVLPSPLALTIDTVWPSTAYNYYYQGHGVIVGRSRTQAQFDAEQARFLMALAGTVGPYTRPAGEANWFVIDSKCRQKIWGSWGGGYYTGSEPSLDLQSDPIATVFDTWCSALPVGFGG